MDPNSNVKICASSDPVYADVSLYLQQDTMGNVTFLGVDLKKLGLEPLAQLITIANKAPTLSISGQATETIKSQLDFQIPQTGINPDGAFPSYSDYNKGEICSNGSGSVVDGGHNLISSLGLGAHLDKFLKNYAAEVSDGKSAACLTKLTVQTQFVIVVDAKAGLTPFTGTTYILPVSGVNAEIQPKFTHSLQITLYLEPEDHRVCPIAKASVAPVPRL